jgi:3-hydroxyacyl-[acyl-carrier-protein] dehydratase
MLAGSFYSVTSITQNNGEISGEILFDKDHDIFKGHFPSVPVVPGVCTMQIVKELVEQSIKQQTRLPKASQLKFLNLINPQINPSVFFNIKYQHQQDASIDVTAELKNAERSFFKMKATLVIQ